jgi:hypothetical protein
MQVKSTLGCNVPRAASQHVDLGADYRCRMYSFDCSYHFSLRENISKDMAGVNRGLTFGELSLRRVWRWSGRSHLELSASCSCTDSGCPSLPRILSTQVLLRYRRSNEVEIAGPTYRIIIVD